LIAATLTHAPNPAVAVFTRHSAQTRPEVTMLRPPWKTVLSCLSIVAASHVGAQATACAPTSATLAAGIGQSDRVDMTASPMQFGGRGLDLSGSFEHSRGAFCILATGRGGAKTLRAVSASGASERLMDGDASVAVLRSFGDGESSTRVFAVGAEVRGALALTKHAYADFGRTVSSFRLGMVSLGPVLRWRERIGSGFAMAQLSSPAIAAVDHPYSAVITDGSSPNLRITSVNRLRGGDLLVAYEPFAYRSMSLRAMYNASVLRYDDESPVRALTQSLTLGIVKRLTGGLL
jgi:hypothetical protein